MASEAILVLKIGGGEVDSPDFLGDLTVLVRGLKQPCVIVHGGGKDIKAALEALGQQSRFHEGLRITDDRSIEVIEMVLSGLVNKRLVGVLVSRGVRALGLSGRDLGLIEARKLEADIDLGHVGEPLRVDCAMLTKLLRMGIVPVISPVSQNQDGVALNVNADHAALAVAAGLKAKALVFVSNVPGVFDDHHPLVSLTGELAERLIDSGVIDGGMIPKVRSALMALDAGVARVLITDLEGLAAYLKGKPAATMITR